LNNQYEEAYQGKKYYWGKLPSRYAYKVLELMPPDRPLKLLVIGCGEGRNAVFFARNGYEVTAFDLSSSGLKKTKKYAKEIGVEMNLFEANILEYSLDEPFDILFASGVLHYIPEELRATILSNYKWYTNRNGLHVFNVFVKKPFIEEAPDSEKTAHDWISGELFTHYHDWLIEECEEVIFDCMSSGVPHKHAMDRIIARKS
jgi:tellurite methyltransferase